MKEILKVLVILAICSFRTYADGTEFQTSIKGTKYLITFQKVKTQNIKNFKKIKIIKFLQQNWYVAFKICKRNKMDLITINNEEQFNNVQSAIRASGHNQSSDLYWTSGTDLGIENNFFWSTNGENIEFDVWNHGQPDNSGGNENCVELRYNKKNAYKLNDNNCVVKNFFICQSVDIDVHCHCNVDIFDKS